MRLWALGLRLGMFGSKIIGRVRVKGMYRVRFEVMYRV